MKLKLLATTVILAGICLSVRAGTDMASSPPPDAKEMKGMNTLEPTDAGFYVAAAGGAQFSTDYGDNRQSVSNAVGTFGTGAEIHSNWGGVGGVKVGYKFNSFPLCNYMSLRLQPAVEAEALYIGDDSHASNLAGDGSYEHFTTNSGDFFLNGLLRFKNSSMVTPYLGVGVGLQYFTTHGYISLPAAGVTATGLDTSDLDFAAQALCGFDVAVTQRISLFTEYKFIDALGTNAGTNSVSSAFGNGTYRFKPDEIEQNLITAGVKFGF